MTEEKLKAPFPYFGGKSKVAEIIWRALGQPRHYIEPFFGSGAVLLLRPDYDPASHTESVCDKDGFVANVWRSIQFSPDETAKWCDWPVNHADLSARKNALLKNEDRLLENLTADDMWHDPKIAGYWIWAASCWIGNGLTSPTNAMQHISSAGDGVHKMPHIIDAGKGVHAGKQGNIYDLFQKLSDRMRRVRVVCGDWTRVCGGNWQTGLGTCGMFFDPPYGVENRDVKIYHHDTTTVARDVEAWCLARGDDPKMRIVVAGYEDEYKTLESAGWSKIEWTAHGGYANIGKQSSQGKENKGRERLWFSTHCLQENNDEKQYLF